MANQNNTFDPMNMMKDWQAQMQQMLQMPQMPQMQMPQMPQMQMPNLDMENAMQSQRKTAEACSQHMRAHLETMRNLSQMQAQFSNQWMETLRHASQQMANPGKWEDKLSQGTEVVKQNLHNSMNYLKQASAALADTTYRGVDSMMNRLNDHMDETVTVLRKSQSSKK